MSESLVGTFLETVVGKEQKGQMGKGFPCGSLVGKEKMPVSSNEPGGPVGQNSEPEGPQEPKPRDGASHARLAFCPVDVISEGTARPSGWALAPEAGVLAQGQC